MSRCCDECAYWTREMWKRRFMRAWPIWLALAAALALFACATPPRYSDGTRAGLKPIPCNSDNCGKNVF